LVLDHEIPLSRDAQKLLAEIPKINAGQFVFTYADDKPIGGFTSKKRLFDERVLAELRRDDPDTEPIANWTIHDLRRSARSLFSAAGVNADIGERCLGHVIGGVRGVYDRHEYRDEKRLAFEALATKINRIVEPRRAAVLPMVRPHYR